MKSILIIIGLLLTISVTTTYGIIIPATGPQLDLVIDGNNYAWVQNDYAIFIEAQDSRWGIHQNRNLIPASIDFTIEITHYNSLIHEIEGKTQKNGKAAISFFVTTHDYQVNQLYNATVTASYNNVTDTDLITFRVVERQ